MLIGLGRFVVYFVKVCLVEQDVECCVVIEVYCKDYRASSIRVRYCIIKSERASFIRLAIR
jgi:hypothetical protein